RSRGNVYTSLEKIADLIGGLKMLIIMEILHLPKDVQKQETSPKAASVNDDNVEKCLRMDVNRGGRNKETEGLVEREVSIGVQETFNAGVELFRNKGTSDMNMPLGNFDFPRIFQRKLDGATSDLGRGPIYKSRPKKAGGLSCRPVCNNNSGECVKTSDVLPTSSGSYKIERKGNGNEHTARHRQQRSRSKKSGSLKPTVKLGVGTRQRICGNLKKIKNKKLGSTTSKTTSSPLDSEQRVEGVTEISISKSNITNMNHLFLQKDRTMNAEEIWGIGKKLSAVFEGEEKDLLLRLEQMEARDIEAWSNMERERKDDDGNE
ncbi:hypothetical protein Ancab_003652, partial [Ancistrocladus abbreviatus]